MDRLRLHNTHIKFEVNAMTDVKLTILFAESMKPCYMFDFFKELHFVTTAGVIDAVYPGMPPGLLEEEIVITRV